LPGDIHGVNEGQLGQEWQSLQIGQGEGRKEGKAENGGSSTMHSFGLRSHFSGEKKIETVIKVNPCLKSPMLKPLQVVI
jgi:hypothetical protein